MQRSPARQMGHSLLETTVAMTIVSLLLIGSMTLYLTAARTTTKTQNQTFASTDGALAAQQVAEYAREAYRAITPDTNSPLYPFDLDSASFKTAFPPGKYSGLTIDDFRYKRADNSVVNTGVQLVFRQVLRDQAHLVNPGDPVAPLVLNRSGNPTSVPAYDYSSGSTSATEMLYLYRARKDGRPDTKATGNWLWVRGVFNGQAIAKPVLALTYQNTLPLKAGVLPEVVAFVAPDSSPSLEFTVAASQYGGPRGQVSSDTTDGASEPQTATRYVALRGTQR
ncbi:MAG: hypothetical protein H7Z41_13560 [Cytophagales bacterium]|nr:hypothetical protein [Armatimonadota bacterium]